MDQTQKNNFVFDIHVEIGVYKSDSPVPEISKFRMNTTQAQFVIPVDTKPEKVVFDPRTVLLAKVDFAEAK